MMQGLDHLEVDLAPAVDPAERLILALRHPEQPVSGPRRNATGIAWAVTSFAAGLLATAVLLQIVPVHRPPDSGRHWKAASVLCAVLSVPASLAVIACAYAVLQKPRPGFLHVIGAYF